MTYFFSCSLELIFQSTHFIFHHIHVRFSVSSGFYSDLLVWLLPGPSLPRTGGKDEEPAKRTTTMSGARWEMRSLPH